MEILDSGDGFLLSTDYASSRYENATMDRFCKLFTRIVAVLVSVDSENYLTVKQLRTRCKKIFPSSAKSCPFFQKENGKSEERIHRVLFVCT